MAKYMQDSTDIQINEVSGTDNINFTFKSGNSIDTKIGDLAQLETTDKSNIVGAINEARLEKYSTTEQVIGKWLDNKPIYRKVVQYSTRALAGLVNIPHGISNLKMVTKIEAVTMYDNKIYTMPLLYSNVSTASYINYVDNTNIVLKLGENWDLYTMYITIEYTKTTD